MVRSLPGGSVQSVRSPDGAKGRPKTREVVPFPTDVPPWSNVATLAGFAVLTLAVGILSLQHVNRTAEAEGGIGVDLEAERSGWMEKGGKSRTIRTASTAGQSPVSGSCAHALHVRRVGRGSASGQSLVRSQVYTPSRLTRRASHAGLTAHLIDWTSSPPRGDGQPTRSDVHESGDGQNTNGRMNMKSLITNLRLSGCHRGPVGRVSVARQEWLPGKKAWTPDFHTHRPRSLRGQTLRSRRNLCARHGAVASPSTSLQNTHSPFSGEPSASVSSIAPRSTDDRVRRSR
jgi:hypothetical protein